MRAGATLATANYRYVDRFGGGKGPILLDGIKCSGNEPKLLDCEHDGIGKLSYCTHYYDVGISCAQRCNESEIRLLDSRVQICHRTLWGDVCGDDWKHADAIVACKELGFSQQGAQYDRLYRYDSFVAFLRTANCDGSENHLIECLKSPTTLNEVSCSKKAFVFCPAPNSECNETNMIRLVGGRTPHDGRVVVCVNGVWVSVCDEKWSLQHARVVCRQLGYNGTSYILHGIEDKPTRKSLYLKPSELPCIGNETSLNDCIHPRAFGINYRCRPGIEAAAVHCTSPTCMDGAVQLVGGYSVKEGKVQVCYSGEWHFICSDMWSETAVEADVVCSTLGFSSELVSVKTTFSPERNPILPKDIQCSGDEVILSKCNFTKFDHVECQQIVGVICEAPCLSGITDHSECSNASTYCPIPGKLCSCASECYNGGQCCPDVGYLPNNSGNTLLYVIL
jgi:hypothetical protein